MDCSLIVDGIYGLRKKMTFVELYPKVFNGLGCGLLAVECLEVLVQIAGGDVAIHGITVCEKGQSGDVGETEEIIADFIDGDTWDGRYDLFFHVRFYGGTCFEFGQRCGELPVGFGDLGSSGSSKMEGRSTRVSGNKEGDRGNCHVGVWGNGHGEV